MKAKRLLFNFLLTIGIYSILFINNSAKAITYEECQNAIRDTAYAYLYRGEGIQYDQQDLVKPLETSLNLTPLKRKYRNGGAYSKTISPLMYFSPEDATVQDPRYLVCSTNVENVLYETFKDSSGKGFHFVDNNGNFQQDTQDLIKYARRISDKTGKVISGWWRNPNKKNNPIETINSVNKDENGNKINYCDITACGSNGDDLRCKRNKKNYDIDKTTKEPITFYDVYKDDNLVVFYKGCINSIKWEKSNFKKNDQGKTVVSTEKSNTELRDIYNKFVSVLKVGDIIVRTTRNDKGNIHGHALIVIDFDGKNPVLMDTSAGSGEGDDSGGKYDMSKKKDLTEKGGTLRIKKLALYGENDDTFNWGSSPSGYFGPKLMVGGSVDELMVIRPSNVILKGIVNNNSVSYNISSNAKNRKGKTHLSLSLTSNREMYDSIPPGDSIVYTLTMTNKSISSKDKYDVSYIAYKPNGTNIVSVTVNGNECKKSNLDDCLKGTATIEKNSKFTLKYKVRIQSNQALNTYITNDQTYVNNIKMKTIKTYVAKHAPDAVRKPTKPNTNDPEELKKYEEKLSKYKIDDIDYSATYQEKDFLSMFYKNYGFEGLTAEKLINDYLFKVNDKVYKLRKYTGASSTVKHFLDMVVPSPQKELIINVDDKFPFGSDKIPGLFGGVKTLTEYNTKLHDGRVLTPRTTTFMEGDILLVVDSNYDKDKSSFGTYRKYSSFIYVDGDQFITLGSDNKIKKLSKKVTEDLIDSLLGQDCFVVLRPRNKVSTTTEVEVTKVSLNKKEATLVVGNSETLTATISPSDATNKTITWKTSDKNVAIVENGKVTAKGSGTATITATSSNGKKATCKVTVVKTPNTPIPVSSLKISVTKLNINVGESRTLGVVVNPSNAANKTVTWTSSDSKIATVDSKGKVTAVAAGTATITVSSNNGKKATCKVTVNAPEKIVEVTSVSISPSSIDMEVGESKTLKVTISPSNATNKTVTWLSSDTRIATVSDNGKVTVKAIGVGTATITAQTTNNKLATCTVTITASKEEPETPSEVTSIKLDQDSVRIVVGDTKKVKATVYPSNATNSELTWTSNDDNIATVDDGTITGVSQGTTTINVTASNGVSAYVTVSVSENNSPKSKNKVVLEEIKDIILSKNELTMYVGDVDTIQAIVSPNFVKDFTLNWKSSNSKIATVNNKGQIQAMKKGIVTITVSSGNISSECKVTVKDRPKGNKSSIKVEQLKLKGSTHNDKAIIELTQGEHETLLVSFEPYNASNKSVTWKSDNSEIVTVDDNGIITARKIGATDIIAESKNGKETRIRVEVVGQSMNFTEYLKKNIILVSVVALIIVCIMFSTIINMTKKKTIVVRY